MVDLVYTPPPTVDRFHLSSAFVKGLRGPVGSAKTTACIMEVYTKAHRIAPCRDGVRRSRTVAIRNTYGELRSTTIKSWESWFGPHNGFPKVVYDTPIVWRYRVNYREGPVEMEVYFLALDRPEDVAKLKSLEATWVWLNEASELPKAVLDMATARVGRFPSKLHAPAGVAQWPSHYGVVMDTNSMDDDHWYYHLAEVEQPKGFAFFTQPGGFSPEAENLENLPGNQSYYTRMAAGKSQAWIDCFIHCHYVCVMDGRAVWPEFNERIHVAESPLSVYRGLPLRLGHDYGLTPATVILQVSPRGQVRVLREFCVWDQTMGVRQFTENVVLPALHNEFSAMEVISVGDPGGNIRAQTDERTAMDVQSELGLSTKPAHTNLFTPRRDAVAHYLTRMIDGEPAFILDPSCQKLRRGMNGRYRFRRMALSGEARYTDVPDKNMYSHVCEALQYPLLDLAADMGGARAKARQLSAARRGRYVPVDRAFGY